MSKINKFLALGVSASILGLGLFLPSSALASSPNNIQIDCSNIIPGGVIFVLPNTTEVSVSAQNCLSTIFVDGVDSEQNSVTIPVSQLQTYDENTDNSLPVVVEYENEEEVRTPLELFLYLADPDVTSLSPKTLARTENVTIPATTPQYMNISSSTLGENENCGVSYDENYPEDIQHPYQTLQLEITQAGEFTFRITSTSPNTAQNVTQLTPISSSSYPPPIFDPFLAVYSTFDPNNPDNNLVGCNDDRSALPSTVDGNYLSNGTVLSTVWSQFDAELQPGIYTIVLTTYGTYNSEQWAAQASGFSQTASIQLWGPAGAIKPKDPELAKTGQNSGEMPLGVPLGAGLTALGLISIAHAKKLKRKST